MNRCTICFKIYAPSYLQCGQYCQMCKGCGDMKMENKVNEWARENKAMYRKRKKQKKGMSCFTDDQLTYHRSRVERRSKACEEYKVYTNRSDSKIKENDIIPRIRDVSNLPLDPESHIGIKRKAEGETLTTQIARLNVRLKRCMSCAKLCSETVCSSKEWKKSRGKLRCNVCLKLKSKAGRSDTNAARSDILDMHPAEEVQFPIANESPFFSTIQSNSGKKGVVNPIIETLCNEVKRCSSCDDVKGVKSYTMKQWLLAGKRQCTSCLRSVNKQKSSDTVCNQPKIMRDRYLPEVMKRTPTEKVPPSGNMQPESRGNNVLNSTIGPASNEDKQCSSSAKSCSRELYTLNQWRPHHDGKGRYKACLQTGPASRMLSSELIDYFTKCAPSSPKKMQPNLRKDYTNSIFGTPCKPCPVEVLPPKVKIEESTTITTKKRDASINPSRKLESVHAQPEKESHKRKTPLDACAVASSIFVEAVKVKVEEDQWPAEASLENVPTLSQATEETAEQDKCPVQTTAFTCKALLQPTKTKRIQEDLNSAKMVDRPSKEMLPTQALLDKDIAPPFIYQEGYLQGKPKKRLTKEKLWAFRSKIDSLSKDAKLDSPPWSLCYFDRSKCAVTSTSSQTCKKAGRAGDMARLHPSHAQRKIHGVLSDLSQSNASLENKPSCVTNLRMHCTQKKSSKKRPVSHQDILRKKHRLDCSASTSSPPKKRSKLTIVSNSHPLKVSKNMNEIRSAAKISVMQFVIPKKSRYIGRQSMDPGTTKIVDHQVGAKSIKSLKVLAGVTSNEPSPTNPRKNRSTGDKDSFKEARENVSKSSKNKVSIPSSSSRMPTSACSKCSDSSGIIQTSLSSKSSLPHQEKDAASVETMAEVENNGEGNIFVVEKIIDDRQTGKEGKEFLIKWKGYPAKYNTWEHEHNILDPILIRRYVCRETLKILKKRPTATDATTIMGRCVNALEFGIIEMDIDPTAPFDASKRTCPFCLETFDSGKEYLVHVRKHKHDDGYELLKGIAKLAPNKWYTSGVWI